MDVNDKSMYSVSIAYPHKSNFDFSKHVCIQLFSFSVIDFNISSS